METGPGNDVATWNAAGCPFAIEYSRRTLDDIRLAVVDAFFSLPRGGAEIGGILLGKYENRRLSILDYSPLECEHALGPSFTLSPRDHARLAELVSSARRNPGDRRPVGWYHSHTRSEIFLSEADLDIHKRYFPEPWQVALVLKPHTFHPARAGFFFREADGKVRGDATYCEFALPPMPMRTLPGAAPSQPMPPADCEPDAEPPPIAVSAPAEVLARCEPSHAPEPPGQAARPVPHHEADEEADGEPAEESEPRPVVPPSFDLLGGQRERPARGFRAVLAVAALLAVAAAGFETQALWLPRVKGAFAGAPPYIGLNTIDRDGQLQIRWDSASAAVRNGIDAILEIADGGPVPQAIRLDPVHLRAGIFTYGRQGERVDVTLTLHLPDGRQVREATSFLGGMPAPKAPPAADPALRNERDQLAREAARLRSDLGAETERNRRLQKSLDDARAALKQQQRRRLRNQSPDSLK